ncbi:MAG TPA: hypothetical protein VMQ86_04465 [Bryobacteraceae bacterium]|jgi:hypothetical protein|nr:hypothetical protein [Bryobacteraceae bacterium]
MHREPPSAKDQAGLNAAAPGALSGPVHPFGQLEAFMTARVPLVAGYSTSV